MSLSNKSTRWLKKKLKILSDDLVKKQKRIWFFVYHTPNQRSVIRDCDVLSAKIDSIRMELYNRDVWRFYGDKPGSPHTPRYKTASLV